MDWAENAIMEADFEEENLDEVKDIVGRLGLADVKTFGMNWEDCEEYLVRLGYNIKIEITEKEATA